MFCEWLFINGRVWTVNSQQPWGEALAVSGNRILAVGKNRDLKSLVSAKTQVVDLQGRLLLPGFNDAHLHFENGGESLIGIQLRDAATPAEFVRRIAEYTEKLPDGEWIIGGEWDHEIWPEQQLPTRDWIDAVTPNHPVLVERLDEHVQLANQLALKIAGIDRNTPDPPGGKIGHFADSGEPNGLLVDEAVTMVMDKMPPKPIEKVRAAIQAAMKHAASVGITSIQDDSNPPHLRVYQELRREENLLVRINSWNKATKLYQKLHDIGLETPFGDDALRIGTMKLFADGSMGAGSALISQPYPGEESNYGLAIYEPDALNKLICEIDAVGLQAAVHAIGDVANQQVLDAFELARQKNGNRHARHRIEHAQMVQPGDVKRFAELGVIASVQPSHAIDDMRWAEKRIGAELVKDAYRVQSFRDAGATVVFGTDWPVEPLNPLLGIYAAVTREAIGGGPDGGWHPHEKMKLADAIESYTLLPAYAEFTENRKGSLVPGKLADLIVLENNIFEIEPAGWLETKVLLTMVDGKITWREGRI